MATRGSGDGNVRRRDDAPPDRARGVYMISETAGGHHASLPVNSTRGSGDGNVRRRDDAPPDRARGVYMISVAAELAGMHPQTLRIYEARGLIEPQRSAGNTRLYSQEDVE